MTKVLVLGITGMLGSMVYDYFSRSADYKTIGSKRFVGGATGKHLVSFDVEKDEIETVIKKVRPDYIINCIGIINIYCRDDNPEGVSRAIMVNALFPHLLAKSAEKYGVRVLQIATDCVFNGSVGRYAEDDPHDALDVYGKTKSLGEVRNNNFLNIRCSIIGPERKNKASLLAWFLNHEKKASLRGYAHHKWNGATTLQFAKVCCEIIGAGDTNFKNLVKASPVYHYIPNHSMSKFELLNVFNKVFKKDFNIERVDNIGSPVDMTLSTRFELIKNMRKKITMEDAVGELKKYIDETDFYREQQATIIV